MSSIKEDFSSNLEVTVVVVVGDADLDRGFGASSRQVFFEGEVLITMDSDRRLRYLSWNLTLKLEVISSFSSSSSQIIRGTNRVTPTSALSLEDEENGDDEEDKVGDEDEEAGSGILSL